MESNPGLGEALIVLERLVAVAEGRLSSVISRLFVECRTEVQVTAR